MPNEQKTFKTTFHNKINQTYTHIEFDFIFESLFDCNRAHQDMDENNFFPAEIYIYFIFITMLNIFDFK